MRVLLTHEESEEIGEPLLIRIMGRYTLSDLKLPGAKKPILKAGELITENHIREIQATGETLQEAHQEAQQKIL
jgi:hypothetical protein